MCRPRDREESRQLGRAERTRNKSTSRKLNRLRLAPLVEIWCRSHLNVKSNLFVQWKMQMQMHLLYGTGKLVYWSHPFTQKARHSTATINSNVWRNKFTCNRSHINRRRTTRPIKHDHVSKREQTINPDVLIQSYPQTSSNRNRKITTQTNRNRLKRFESIDSTHYHIGLKHVHTTALDKRPHNTHLEWNSPHLKRKQTQKSEKDRDQWKLIRTKERASDLKSVELKVSSGNSIIDLIIE